MNREIIQDHYETIDTKINELIILFAEIRQCFNIIADNFEALKKDIENDK